MPKFTTIGYGDRAGYDRTDSSVRDAAHEQDAEQQASGALRGVAGNPVQVRNHDAAGVRPNAGAFMRSDLSVAGFAVIEAATLEEAAILSLGRRVQWWGGRSVGRPKRPLPSLPHQR